MAFTRSLQGAGPALVRAQRQLCDLWRPPLAAPGARAQGQVLLHTVPMGAPEPLHLRAQMTSAVALQLAFQGISSELGAALRWHGLSWLYGLIQEQLLAASGEEKPSFQPS